MLNYTPKASDPKKSDDKEQTKYYLDFCLQPHNPEKGSKT